MASRVSLLGLQSGADASGMRWRSSALLLPLVLQVLVVRSEEAESCELLRLGQYRCNEPKIDENTQEPVNCRDATAWVECLPAPNISCLLSNGSQFKFSGDEVGFNKTVECRNTSGCSYKVAVALSLFLGWLGADRFYLGYPALAQWEELQDSGRSYGQREARFWQVAARVCSVTERGGLDEMDRTDRHTGHPWRHWTSLETLDIPGDIWTSLETLDIPGDIWTSLETSGHPWRHWTSLETSGHPWRHCRQGNREGAEDLRTDCLWR